jgi:hypothetical protein
MNNKIIGLIIAFLYFANYHICNIIYPTDDQKFWYLKVSIYCLIILLAFEYKKQNLLIEKIFLAVIFNNIYVLLFNNETTYSLNDIIFIAWFTAIQYIKHFYNLYKKWSKY